MKTQNTFRAAAALALLSFLWGRAESADLKTLVRQVFPIPSTTGNEDLLARHVREALPRNFVVEEDGLGGFAVRLGKGEPKLLVIAGLDGYGYFVSGITPDGYLTVDRPVAPPHPQYDAYLLGQPVSVQTRGGPLQGVVAQPAMHLLTAERRRTLVENFTLDNAFVDIGVRTSKEARDKGVEILDALTFWPALTELAGDRWAGPALGLKAVVAALTAVASGFEKNRPAGETVFVWAAQTKFAARGRGPRPSIGGLRAKNRWQPQRTIILDLTAAEKGAGGPALGKGPVLVQPKDVVSPLRQGLEKSAGAKKTPVQSLAGENSPLALPFAGPEADVLTLALPVQFLNTPVETVDLKDLQGLCDLLARFLKTGGER